MTIIRNRHTGPPETVEVAFVADIYRSLEVTLTPSTRELSWTARDDKRHLEMAGGHGLIWRNGRLTSRGEGADDRQVFLKHAESLGLTLGWIELELRLVTGYQEGQE